MYGTIFDAAQREEIREYAKKNASLTISLCYTRCHQENDESGMNRFYRVDELWVNTAPFEKGVTICIKPTELYVRTPFGRKRESHEKPSFIVWYPLLALYAACECAEIMQNGNKRIEIHGKYGCENNEWMDHKEFAQIVQELYDTNEHTVTVSPFLWERYEQEKRERNAIYDDPVFEDALRLADQKIRHLDEERLGHVVQIATFRVFLGLKNYRRTR